jgi:two-component system phosphate regulon sensor histidine kinase PhoR
MVETLEAGAADDPEVRAEFLRRIVVEADRLGQIISELLDLARIESGMADLALEQVDLNAVVGAAAERLRPQATRNELQLEIVRSSQVLLVEADTDRVGRVVMSLVHNAIKFTPPAGTISVMIERIDRDAVVRVVDTGEGLNRSERDRVFERFYKTDASRSSSGSGLGLAIARHTVRQHGGRIWVESPGRGQGSTFALALPLHKSHDGAESP